MAKCDFSLVAICKRCGAMHKKRVSDRARAATRRDHGKLEGTDH